MSGKWIAFWSWTTFIVAFLVLAGNALTKDQVHTGTDINFITSRTLQIEAETVTFEAASSDFFVLRKESGETIVGIPTPPPLGWSGSKYFTAESREIPGGEWLFAVGSATVNISSGQTLTVRAVETEPGLAWLALGLLAFLVWLFFIALASP